MSQKHTPGPWTHGCEDVPKSGDIYAEDGSLIAEVFVNGDPESLIANARLIAAAPDLLEALQALDTLFAPIAKDTTAAQWIDKARAAIAIANMTGATNELP